jgi:hypothetical protein
MHSFVGRVMIYISSIFYTFEHIQPNWYFSQLTLLFLLVSVSSKNEIYFCFLLVGDAV